MFSSRFHRVCGWIFLTVLTPVAILYAAPHQRQRLRAALAAAVSPAPARSAGNHARRALPSPLTAIAAKRGGPFINLKNGRPLHTNYVGDSNATSAFSDGQAQPLALSSADFDGDGVPDLVSGYAAAGGAGIVTIHRGNIDALWPYGAALRNGPPPEFLPDARSFSLPESPDFLGTGDFNADGNWDIVAAKLGSNALYFLPGDGHGGFGAPERIALPGGINALVTGEVNRADGLTDIVAAVSNGNSAQALVFESPSGALRGAPEVFALPSPATAIAVGMLGGGPMNDVVVASGNLLTTIHGRDRKLSLGLTLRASVEQATLTKQTLPFSVTALATGNFTGMSNLAALGDDGAVHLLQNSNAVAQLAQLANAPALSPVSSRPGQNSLASAAAPLPNGMVTRQQRVIAAAAKTYAAQKSAAAAHAELASEWQVSSSVSLPMYAGAATGSPSSRLLVTAHISTSPTEDLLVLDGGSNQIHVLSNTAEWDNTARESIAASGTTGMMTHAASLDVASSPVAVLPLRMNQHPLQGLVLLASGEQAPSILPNTPVFTLTVTSTSDSGGSDSLRGAINFINNVQGLTSIVFNIPLSDPNCDQTTHVCTIRPLSINVPGSGDEHALPALFSTTTLDAYTQPGASPNTLPQGDNAVILIRIDGSLATTPGGLAFDVFEQPATIRGFNLAHWNNPDFNSQPGLAVGSMGIEMDGIMAFSEGNFIGTNPTATASVLGTDDNFTGIFINNGPLPGLGAQGNIVGGTTPQARNVLSGNRISGAESTFFGYLTQIQGNFIGTDHTGTLPLGNKVDGLLTSTYVTIGGTLPGARNIISGNDAGGGGFSNIDINAKNGAGLGKLDIVQGNFIGTDVTGTKSLSPVLAVGVLLAVNTTQNTIGGTSPAARNIISGNSGPGINIFDNVFNNLILGNYIGTDFTGTHSVPNTNTGIFSTNQNLFPPAQNPIGGATPGAGNLISGNSLDGIRIAGNYQNSGYPIQGNLIGTDVTGANPLPNTGNGIFLTGTPVINNGTAPPIGNLIGGSDVGTGNVISFNGAHGILIDSGTANSTIGNVIHSNVGAGVRITGGNGNPISRNSIFANGALGIDLDTAGPLINSHCQANTNGANNLQNAPVLTAGAGSAFITATATDPGGNTSEFSNAVQSSISGNVLTLMGSFDSKPSTTYTIEFFSSTSADPSGFGQGQTFLTSTTVTTDATCSGLVHDPVDLTQADVSVAYTVTPFSLQVGPDFGGVIFASVVANNGPAIAHNVVFTDPLPAGLKVSSSYCNIGTCASPVITTVGTCSVVANVVTCNLGAMPPGSTAAISIPVETTAAGSITNVVNVTATEVDPNPANNSASTTKSSSLPGAFVDHLDTTEVLVNSPDLPLTVFGIGFFPNTAVTVNGTPVTVTGFLDNQGCATGISTTFCQGLQVTIPASFLTTPGTLTINAKNPGQPFSLTAALKVDASCTYSSLSNGNIGNQGTTLIDYQLFISAIPSTCSWTASSAAPWIVPLDSPPATGSGVIDFAVAPNTTAGTRVGNLTIAGQTITVTQPGGATCDYTLNPTTLNIPASGGSGSIGITAPSGCAAFATQALPWITTAGSLTSTITYTIAPNLGGPRTGAIMIGGETVAVNQAAAGSCWFTLSSNSALIATNGGTGSVAITASLQSCPWTATSDNPFVNITSGASGTGNGTIQYSVPANTGDGRSAIITAGNSTSNVALTLQQASANTCTATLSPAVVHFGAEGGSNLIGLSQSYFFCKWVITSVDPALEVSATSGSFGTPIMYTVAQNTGPARTLTLVVACQTFTVLQDGAGAGNPAPVVTTLQPPSVAASSGAFTLTVNGSNFVNGALVTFGGLLKPTTFVNSGQVTASISDVDVSAVGTPGVTVTNPAPGGGISNTVNFSITGSNPVPTITTLQPSTVNINSGASTLTVNGTNFISSSIVNFNGSPRATTVVSTTQLTAAILATDVTAAGDFPVTVTNPAPGGGTSNSVNLSVIIPPNPVPVVTSVSPSSTPVGSADLVIDVFGNNFVSTSTVNFKGNAEFSFFIDPGFLIAVIPAADMTTVGTFGLTVTNPAPGGGTSNSVNFDVTGNNPVPAITSLSPSSTPAGSPGFSLTVTGTNFVSSSAVTFGGVARTTTFVDSSHVMAAILAADVAAVGTPAVIVTNPAPGGGASNSVNFTVTPPNPVPTVTTLQPANALVASGAFTLTVNGTNFVGNSVVNFNGSPKATTFVSATQLTASILAGDVTTVGTPSVTVTNPAPGGGTSNSIVFSILNPVPTVTTLQPAGALTSSGAFTLTVNGTNFVNGAVVSFGGANRATTFVNSTQVTAAILATDITTAGAPNVLVTNPAPGGGSSNSVSFNVNNPVPTVTTLQPSSVIVGSGAFTLAVNGTNFVNGATVSIAGANRTTTFVSATQVTASILATDIAATGTPAVVVTNPAPGGGPSNSVSLSVNNPVPAITTLQPSGTTVNSGAFTLTVNGTNFVNGATVNFGGTDRVTSFVSATQVTAAILATDITTIGTPAVIVTNPAPGGGASNSVNFNVSAANNPVPTVTTLQPSSAVAGSGAFTLTVNGTNFVSTSVVNFNGAPRATTFVNATQITASILAGDVTTVGTPGVTVTNPSPGGGTSNSVAFNVNNPVPVLTSLLPNSAIVGGAGFTLTVNGGNFLNASVVQWNGSARATTFINPGQLTAAITAADIQTLSAAVSITVVNPAPGGGPSNSLPFAVTVGTPTLISLQPNSATAGGAAFTLTVNGTNFFNGSVVQWNGSARTTSFINSTQVTAAIPATDIQTAGTAQVTVFNAAPAGPSGSVIAGAPIGVSNSLPFTINPVVNNPVPTLTSLAPTSTGAGGSAFTLTVTGTNFISSSVVQWKGSPRTTTFVSATQLTAAISAADIAASGAASVTVFNPTPGGGTSNALTFTITDFSVTSTTPSQTVTAGQPAAFTISTATVGGAFPGTVSFSASGLPSGATASFTPPSVAPGASTTMTVSTTPRTTTLVSPRPSAPRGPIFPAWLALLSFAMLLASAAITGQVRTQVRTQLRRFAPAAALALLVIATGYLAGCAGGFPKVGTTTGTPAGSYTITVTGTSGSVTHSTTVTLTVQ